jgi:NAD(P)-dependent dehydrogenase (short-subunit alcohol dehydrogenase family)
MKVSERVALITGGGTGIGLATADALLREGWKVAISGRRADVLEEARSALGADVLAIAGDVANAADCDAMIQKTVERFGRLDLLVNNAAIYSAVPTLEEDEDAWLHQFDINLHGPWRLCRLAHPHLKRSGRGCVINVLSTLAHQAAGSVATYCSSKAALEMLGRCLALEWADDGIRVNAVSPGVVDTPIHGPGGAQGAASMHPLGRIGRPEEIAAAIVFLASDASSWTTGANLDVDGGVRIA